MLIHKSRITFIVFILWFGFVSVCKAITFGNIKVYSYLDEPLVAELELTDLNGISPDNLLVSLADSKDFVRAGLDRPYFLTNLLFYIIVYQEKTLIFIRSAKPVKTPYLEFLLNLSWMDGSLVKEYTILIDPPPFNLNAATRPKALSQLAMQESESKSFSDDNISQQLAAQELASRPNVVLQRPRDVTKDAFNDDTIDAPDPSTAIKATAATAAATTATTGSATTSADATQPTSAAADQSTVVAPPAPPPPPPDAEYKKQVEDFKKSEQEQKAKDQASNDLLDRVIDRFKSSALVKGSNIDVTHLADQSAVTPGANTTAPAAAQTATPTAAVAPTTTAPTSSTPTPTPITATVTPAPTAATPMSVTAPTAELHADQKSSARSTFTILVGVFLLIVAAGVAFVIKRKIRFNPKAVQAAMESIVDPNKKQKPEVGEDENLEFDIDLSDKQDDTPFKEELASTNPQKSEMDSFEDQLSNGDLDKLLQTEKPADVTSTSTAAAKPAAETEENINITAMPVANASQLDADTAPAEGSVEALNLKIELAKSYLEAGDKDSAKDLLNEVISEAKGEQKLAAELLLSGIL